ncbi:MAG: DNA mismatch repair protein MutS [Armatimonadota bacterium]
MAAVSPDKLTPMLRQYVSLKEERPDVLLLMRVGDFYEAYGDDAVIIARELEIALTGRDVQGLEERYPMAGVPHHALDRYLARLVRKGHKVALCDQVEDPKQAKGLVRREVTRIVTPGTLVEDSLLEARANNFLVAAVLSRPVAGIGVVDVSTGEFLVTEIPEEGGPEAVAAEVARLQPAECLVPEGMDDLAEAIVAACPATLTRVGTRHRARDPRATLLDHFGTTTLRGFGCEDYTAGLDAAATLLAYLRETHQGTVSHVRALATWSTADTMVLDAPARRNLELTAGLWDQARGKSLLAVLDATRTAMGGRLLRRWLDAPLLKVAEIDARLDAVTVWHADPIARGDLREALGGVADLERLVARCATGVAHPRDLAALRDSLGAVPAVAAIVAAVAGGAPIDPLAPLRARIAETLEDEPAATLREGGVIRAGCDPELDALREVRSGGRGWIAALETEERERTGIRTLKVGYNSVFGYYIEVGRAHVDAVPDTYIRKQTTAQGERYVTPELKDAEARILGAAEKIVAREQALFAALRDRVVGEWSGPLLDLARDIARIDTVAALAEVAAANRYVRPVVDESSVIEIRQGRHPVVEKLTGGAARFIPNDTLLDDCDSQVHIITGPNSAGKSTVLRQVALIVLMAQVGSFVPAEQARIGVVDRIFTRVGAHDDLAAGQSTFMVEMTEAAEILHNATARSLVILDEIGRGTSTWDGLSIAWAVAEHLAGLGCRTLFATHYHLLNELEKQLPNVRNFRIAVKETGDRILWLRKVLPGGTDKSYGIQVARMAGLPDTVVERAREVLGGLERESRARRERIGEAPAPAAPQVQMTLFAAEPHPVVEELKAVDIDTLTPLEALNLLHRLHREAAES